MYSAVCGGFENSIAGEQMTMGLDPDDPRGTFCEGRMVKKMEM